MDEMILIRLTFTSEPNTEAVPAAAAAAATNTATAVITDVPTDLPDVVGPETCQTLNA